MRKLWSSKAVWRHVFRVQSVAQQPRHPSLLHHRDVRWLAGAAGGVLGIAGLLTANRPVLAKEVDVRQEVWVWGRRNSIPGGAERDALRPLRVKWFENHKSAWKKLAFGPSFGAALDCDGKVFVWGVSEIETSEGPEEIFVGPSALDVQGSARDQRIIDVQCSSQHIFVLTANGGTFVFEGVEESLRSPKSAPQAPLKLVGQKMPGIPQPGLRSRIFGGGGVVQMSIGLEHAAFVTHRGELLCTGANKWGQCGEQPPKQKAKTMGAWEETVHVETVTPVRVTFPKNASRITSVSVGGHHTIAVDDLGQMFSFGDDRRIQLGLGDTRTVGSDERNAVGVLNRDHMGGKETKSDLKRRLVYKYYDPHMQAFPVELLPPPATNRPAYPPAQFVACGQDFTIAGHRDSPDWYAADKETSVLFFCGENGEGQSGRNRQQQQTPWQQVRLPKRARTVAVACGQGHSIAQLASGELWAWGMNQQGEVGNGSRASTCPPVKITLDLEGGVPRKVLSVACGFRNSGCICEAPAPRSEDGSERSVP